MPHWETQHILPSRLLGKELLLPVTPSCLATGFKPGLLSSMLIVTCLSLARKLGLNLVLFSTSFYNLNEHVYINLHFDTWLVTSPHTKCPTFSASGWWISCLRFFPPEFLPLPGSPAYPLLPSYWVFSSLLNHSEVALGRWDTSSVGSFCLEFLFCPLLFYYGTPAYCGDASDYYLYTSLCLPSPSLMVPPFTKRNLGSLRSQCVEASCLEAYLWLLQCLVQRAGWEACLTAHTVIDGESSNWWTDSAETSGSSHESPLLHQKLEMVTSCLMLLLLTHIGKCSCPSLSCPLNLFISCFQCDAPTLLCLLGSVLSFSIIVFLAKAGSCLSTSYI